MAKKQPCTNPHYLRMSDDAIFCENCGEIRSAPPKGYHEHIHWGWYPEYVKPWWVQPSRPMWYSITSAGSAATYTPSITSISSTTGSASIDLTNSVDI